MLWYEVLKYIQSRMNQETNAEAVLFGAVKPQMLGLKPDAPGKLLLIRGSERDTQDDGLSEQKEITVYLECWIRDDEQDMCSGYRRLAELEEQVDTALLEIKKESGVIVDQLQLMDLEVKSKSGDLDTMRPLIGSQYEIAVTVYDGA